MKILVACEESQAVTFELRNLGHEAYSCDILPTSGQNPQWHIQSDVKNVIYDKWEMILAFPPCTHLASSGAAWFEQKRLDGRQQLGIDLFMLFTDLNCPKIVIENPVGIMSSHYRKPDQIIQPYQFGDPYEKRTCLWIKGLPKLNPTNVVKPEPRAEFASGRTMPKWYSEVWNAPRSDWSRIRSKTFPGIANAMAQQWGNKLDLNV